MTNLVRMLGSTKVLVRIIPLLVMVILMAPTWVAWIFLSQSQRDSTIDMVNSMVGWVSATADINPAEPDRRSQSAEAEQGKVPESVLRNAVAVPQQNHPPSAGLDTKDDKSPGGDEIPL